MERPVNRTLQQLVDGWTGNTNLSGKQRWQEVCLAAQSNDFAEQISSDQWRALWKLAYANHQPSDGPCPIWSPTASSIAGSNIARLCKRFDLSNYWALHRWSVQEPGVFWRAMCEQLQVDFHQNPTQWLDSSGGTANAKWFVDAKLNIVEACLPELRLDSQFTSQATSQSSDLQQAIDPKRDAIVWQSPSQTMQRWSAAELAAKVQRFSAALTKQGYAGKRIAVVMPMTAASVAIYLGIIHCGGAVISIADSFSPPEIAKRLRIADADLVVTYDVMQRGGKQLPLLSRVHQATQLPALVLACGDVWDDREQLPGGMRPTDTSLSDVLKDVQNASASAAASCDSADVINILFSSGTTGDPKAIPWTHQTPLKCAVDGLVHQDIRPGDIVAWPTNLGWMMGPWLIFASLINRATIALYDDAPVGEPFGRFIQDAGVTMLGLVPSMVKSWRSNGCMEGLDWSNIRTFSSTGESSHQDDYFYLSSLAGFKPIIEYCGGTEIGGGYISSTVVQDNCPATFSTPAIGLDFEILDNDGQPADEGELFLVPPSIGLSQTLLNRDHYQTYYEGVPELASKRVLRRHGDHFRRLPGGYFEAGGRVDDTMNLGGIKVSSIELEKALNALPGVKETAAVAVSNNGGPDALVVFVVMNQASTQAESIDWNDLQNDMNQQLKKQMNPLFKVSQVQVIDHLPRTASNKIMRRLLRDQLL